MANTPKSPDGEKKKRGRPSKLTLETAAEICELVACGSNLTRICKQPEMPDITTVLKWLAENPDFSQHYARAREMRADARADRIDAITEKLERGEIDANSARVMIDAEKWQAGKEQPKRYGDKQTLDVKSDSLDNFFKSIITKTGLHNDT